MSMKIYVKACEGLSVRDPLTNRMITSDGMQVRNTSFMRRRIADGSLALCEPKKQKPTKKGDK